MRTAAAYATGKICCTGSSKLTSNKWGQTVKLVSFEVNTALGRHRRIGVPIDGDETGRIADLTSCYSAYLADQTDEPTPREIRPRQQRIRIRRQQCPAHP
mgnify:CR=1 FL=1